MGLTQLRCPICKKKVAAEDPNMPFCSDRCRAIDLGNWATEKYVISKPNHASELETEELGNREEDEAPEGHLQ